MNKEKAQNRSYDLWEKHVGGGYLIYPNENLTRFIFANRDKFNSVLDFGCGDGRHLEMMCRAGIKNLIGIDCAKSVLDIASRRCTVFDSKVVLYNNDLKTELFELIDFKKVDCVVCWGVMFLNMRDVAQKILLDFNSCLNSGGIFMANWRTRRDSLYEKGTKIDDDTFIIDSGSHKELLYYFPDLDTIRQLYADSGFEIVSVDYEEFSQDNGKTINSWYIIKSRRI